MNVVHYYHWALKGDFGTGIAVRGWSEWLARTGDDVRLLAGTSGAKVSVPEGVQLVPLPETPNDLPIPGSLRKHFRGADAVVLHGGWDVRNLIAASDARAVDVPYIVNPHGGYYPQVFERRKVALKRVWWTTLERRYLERALAVHLFFEDEIDHLARRGFRPRTILAPNGFVAPAGVEWQPSDDPYLVWLGRYDREHKGLDLLVEAVARLPRPERPRIRLHGVNWKRQMPLIARMVEESGTGEWITVGSPVYGSEKWRLLAGAHGFLYPSRWDASPIAVVEAVSIGLPTLVTSFPLGRFISDRGGAIGIEATSEAIAGGLRRLLDPDAVTIARRGADVIRTELSWERVVASWRAQVTDCLVHV